MANARLYRQLSHCTYECEYHIVWVCKYRQKVLSEQWIKQEMQRIIWQIAKWKQVYIKAWYIGDEHIHLYVSIPPKYSVAYMLSIFKGKSSSWIKKKTKKIPKGSIWTRGYFVSTVGINKYQISSYIKNQSHQRSDQPRLFT
jgi:putative transposase